MYIAWSGRLYKELVVLTVVHMHVSLVSSANYNSIEGRITLP